LRRFGLNGRDKLGCKVRGQTLNDVEQLQDFLLTQGFNLVVQQFDFELSLQIYFAVVLCVSAVNLGSEIKVSLPGTIVSGIGWQGRPESHPPMAI
jgi:hypothetical protein